jgi:hypothetical protein
MASFIPQNTLLNICRKNTIVNCVGGKENELGFKEEEYFKGRKNRQQATIVKLVEILVRIEIGCYNSPFVTQLVVVVLS